MSVQKLILNIALMIVDILTFWMTPKKNRITFVSMTQNKPTEDFLLLGRELEKEYDVHYNLMVFQKNLMGRFQYFLNCLKQEIDFKRSSLVILNDNNYCLSRKKPKGCRVLQVWHACGAIKKFGNEVDRSYTISNYDWVLCNAPAWKPVYARSFGVSEEQVLVTGMPRTDRLLKEMDHTAFFEKYPQCKGKKLCLYAPTFRGNMLSGFQRVSFDIKQVQDACEDWVVLYKFHPLLEGIQVPDCQAVNVHEEDLYLLMQVSDCLISDYSSVILDYSLLKKPIIGYMDDLDQYKENIGLNIDLEQYPGPICTTEEQLIQTLQQIDALDRNRVETFQKEYMVYTDGQNTKRVIEWIRTIL